jgi:hypothetical protein
LLSGETHLACSAEEDIDIEAVGDADEDLDAVAEAVEGMCVECTDQPAALRCDQCRDDYCDVCFQALHRRGTRKAHVTTRLAGAGTAGGANGDGDGEAVAMATGMPAEPAPASEVMGGLEEAREQHQSGVKHIGEWFVERAKYIPLRLSYEERKYLRLLEATLNVSEYTDKVDIVAFMSSKAKRIVEQVWHRCIFSLGRDMLAGNGRPRRALLTAHTLTGASTIHQQVRDICAILSGLLLACDYKAGQKLVSDREFKDNAEFFQTVFEIGRRYKILNPGALLSLCTAAV